MVISNFSPPDSLTANIDWAKLREANRVRQYQAA
jgi:hypothetical protein